MPVHLAVWSCLLAIFSPRRFLEFQERTTKKLGVPAASENNSVFIVSHAFWFALVLVLVSGAVGAVAGLVCGLTLGVASARVITWLQLAGALLLLWGTLFVRGWQIQTYRGQTLIERVNQWIYRAFYCLGTATLVASLTWRQA
jgi:hypothetical protein